MWISKVRVFADKGDSWTKAVSNGRAHELFAAMDEGYQKVLDAEILHENLTLDLDEEGVIRSFKDHKEIVEKILNVIANDSTTDFARTFINFGRQVLSCKRKNGESYGVFLERFRGVTQNHLNAFDSVHTEHDKQQTALILLENAGLADSIYNNLLTILINKSLNSVNPGTANAVLEKCELVAIARSS